MNAEKQRVIHDVEALQDDAVSFHGFEERFPVGGAETQSFRVDGFKVQILEGGMRFSTLRFRRLALEGRACER